jgi:hypothetical protein
LRGEDGGGNLTNVQCKPTQNCHKEFPLYNEHSLLKKEERKKEKKHPEGKEESKTVFIF